MWRTLPVVRAFAVGCPGALTADVRRCPGCLQCM